MNPLLEVMNAVCNSTSAISAQQLADGDSTLLSMNIEQGEYNTWTKKVSDAADAVNTAAAAVAKSPTDQKLQAALTAAQTQFQNTETQMQTYTQQADGATQAEQNQVGQDSSNVQNKVQLEAAVNQVLQTLTAALGSNY